MREVTAGLAHSRQLTRLSLSYSCRHASLDPLQLEEALVLCSELRVLELAGNRLRHVGVTLLAVVLGYCCQLQRLDLADNEMQELLFTVLSMATEAIHHRISSPRALSHLDLSSNQLRGGGAKAMACLLPHCAELESLLLADAGLSEADVVTLVGGLSQAHKLRRLDLSGNRVGDEGVSKLLLEGPGRRTSLSELSLVGSGIGVRGAGSLALSLAHCPNLSALHIAHNDFPPELAWTLGLLSPSPHASVTVASASPPTPTPDCPDVPA